MGDVDNLIAAKGLKSCPKSNISSNLATLLPRYLPTSIVCWWILLLEYLIENAPMIYYPRVINSKLIVCRERNCKAEFWRIVVAVLKSFLMGHSRPLCWPLDHHHGPVLAPSWRIRTNDGWCKCVNDKNFKCVTRLDEIFKSWANSFKCFLVFARKTNLLCHVSLLFKFTFL